MPRLHICETGTGADRRHRDFVLDLHLLPSVVARAKSENGKSGLEAAQVSHIP
jgi:hypothetical protein